MRMSRQVVNLVLFVVASTVAYAQGEHGSILGTVTDASGAFVANAAVKIRSNQTEASVTVRTGVNGNYASAPLRPGAYTLTVESPGFRKIIQPINLDVDQRAQVNFALQPGEIEESITVAGGVQLLETQSAAIGNVRTLQAINDLPLNGRDFVQLFHLASGVSTTGGSNTLVPSVSNQTGVQGGAVNGARASGNNFQFDGIQSQDNEQGVLIFMPNPDAIEEFKVETSGMDASFGRAGGGTINLVMKSGANQFHGALFEFLRNSQLDAKNYFDSHTGPTPPFKQNQFGGTAGGRIIRNRTFFFLDYQGTRNRQAQTLLSTVPTVAMKQGNFSQLGVTLYDPATTANGPGGLTRSVFPNATIPLSRFNSAGLNMINLYPDPNLPGLTNNFLVNPEHRADPNQFDTRVDHRISNRDSLFTRFSYFNQPAYNPGNLPGPAIGGGPGFPGNFITAGDQAVAGLTHTFSPAFLYEFRAGYSRLNVSATSESQGTNLASKIGIPGINEYGYNQSGLGLIGVTGYTGLGEPNLVPATKITNNFEYSHRFTLIRGRHTYKWGYDLLRRGLNAYAPTTGMGAFTFTGQFTQNPLRAAGSGSALADIALGLDSTGRMSFWQEYGIRRWENGLFFNDDYRVTRKLTLNLGLRYDLTLPWTEVHNRMSNFVPALGDVFPVGSQQAPGNTMQAANYKNYSPRFGLAYELTPKTIVRASYGIFYMFPPTGTASMGITNAPFSGSLNITNNVTATDLSTVIPLSAGFPLQTPGNFKSAGNNFAYWPYHQPDSYMQQRNFSVQRLLGSDMALTFAYVGSRGLHLQIYPDINQPVPGPGAAGPRRAYPNLGTGGGLERIADSYYNSFQSIVEKRFARGFAFQAAYTWSHSVDEGSIDSQFGSPQNILNLRGDRGNSDFDVRHRVVVSWSYELPFGKGKLFGKDLSGFSQSAFGGWQLNGIGTFSTGVPFSVAEGPNTLGSGGNAQRPDRIGNGNLPSNQRTILHWFDTAAFTTPALYTYGNAGRNTLDGPGTKQIDFSLFKKFPLWKESQVMEFRAEAFNTTNSPQFNTPNATIGTSAAGVISSAGTPQFFQRTSRQIQLALKFYF